MSTGSFFNNLYGNAEQHEPKVGDGATRLMWTDRVAGTIVEVKTVNGKAKSLIFQEDKVTRTDNNGMSESQQYSFEPNPDAPRVEYTLRKNGAWVRSGDSMKNGERLLIGARSHYHDFSF